MARTVTGTERTNAGAASLACFGKLEIQDPDLVWRDVTTSLSTPDWFNSATLTENIDSNTMAFSASLLRDTGTLSLAPLRTDSTINRNAAAAYAPMLDTARKWRLSCAVIPQGTAPVAGDWKEIGMGVIDVISINDAESTITITGRDLGAALLDAYIPIVRPVYSGAGTTPMETVIQQILDDNLGSGRANVGSSGITLYTPVSPSFTMNPLNQGVGNLMDALTKIAQLAGFVLRFRYDASNVLRLTLMKPNRTASVADWTIGASEYLALPVNTLDLSGVRNYLELYYIDASTGTQHVQSPAPLTGTLAATSGAATFSVSQAGVIANGSVVVVAGLAYTVSAFNGTTGCTLSGSPTFAASPWTTSASLTRYGLRYMRVDLTGGTQISASGPAQAMCDAMRGDLELPALAQQFETYGFWFVQLYDYGQLLANGVHYNTDQFGGVTGFTHTLQHGTMKSSVSLRGKPAGRYRAWQSYVNNPAGAALSVTPTPGPTSYTIVWSGDGALLSIDGASPPTLPSASPISVARNAPGGADKVYTFSGTNNGKTVTNTVTVPAQSGSTLPSASLIPSLTTNQLDDTTSPVTLTMSATNLPATYTWALYPAYARGGTLGVAVASGSNSVSPLSGSPTYSVTPALKLDKWYRLVVTVGSDTYVADCVVNARFSYFTQAGVPQRGYAMDDGLYAVAAGSVDGRAINANVYDGRGSLINTMFRTPTDTIDSIIDGATYRRPTLNEATGGGFGYTDLDATGVKAGKVLRGRALDDTYYATVATTTTGYALHGSVVDTRASAINTMFRTPVDTLDSVIDGATYRRPTLNEASGGGFGYTNLDASGVKAGRVIRARSYDDGIFAARAQDTAGINIHSTVTDSRGAFVNGMYRTSTDTADNVLDGASRRTLPFSVIRSSDNALLTRVDGSANIGDQSAAVVARRMTSLFAEVVDSAPSAATGWVINGGGLGATAVPTAVANAGNIVGKNIARWAGFGTMEWGTPIAFNPAKLYRIRARVRTAVANTTGTSSWYVGVYCEDATGAHVANSNGGVAYVCVVNGAPTVGTWTEYIGWFQGATLALATFQSSPSTDPRTPAALSIGTTQITPLVFAGYNGSGGTFEFDYLYIDEYDEDGSARTYNAIDPGNNLQSGVLANNGTAARKIASGRIRNTLLTNAQTASFTGNIPDAPLIAISGGVSYEPGSVWGNALQADGNAGAGGLAPLASRQVDECYASNITLSGYTVRARLRQLGGAVTPRSDTAWSPSPITAVNTGSVVTSASAPAYDDTYTANFSYTFTRGSGQAHAISISVTVSFDYYNGTSWVSTNTATFSASDPGLLNSGSGAATASGTFALAGTVTSRISTSQFRLVITSVTVTGSGTTSLSLTPTNLAYSTTAADQYASKTPAGINATADITGAS